MCFKDDGFLLDFSFQHTIRNAVHALFPDIKRFSDAISPMTLNPGYPYLINNLANTPQTYPYLTTQQYDHLTTYPCLATNVCSAAVVVSVSFVFSK